MKRNSKQAALLGFQLRFLNLDFVNKSRERLEHVGTCIMEREVHDSVLKERELRSES